MPSTFSLRARALLALGLLVLFPVLIVLLIVVIMVAIFWLTAHGVVGAELLFLLVLPLILTLGAGIWGAVAARRPKPVVGDELIEAEHPALWAEFDRLATAMSQRRPDRVVVVPRVNASVTAVGRHREIAIGYPLLAGLSQLQLRAVLAHEMGHLAHGHTRTGWLSYRAGVLLEQAVADLRGNRARGRVGQITDQVRRLVVLYYRLYLTVSMSVRRDHERQADDWAARLAGGPASASTFLELARLDLVWGLLLTNYHPQAVQVGARPALSEAIRELAKARSAELDQAVARRFTDPPSRWSSHPSDAERRKHLLTGPERPPVSDEDQPAWHLLGRPADQADFSVASQALLEIEASLLPRGAPRTSWEQVLQQAAIASARRDLRLVLAPFATRTPDRRATLRDLLETLSTGAGGDLAGPLISKDLPRGYWHAALNLAIAQAVRAALLITLADQGRARVQLRWDGPATLEYLTAFGQALPWPDHLTLTGPLEPAQVSQTLDALVQDGVDVDALLITEIPGQAGAEAEPAVYEGW